MLSIVIPVYNVERYLDDCVESVLKLKTKCEIILVDDGSTDNSGSLCDEWGKREPNIKVVHKTNGGLSSARNIGIKNSSGDFVMFLDSDDFLNPIETDQMLANLEPSVDVLVGLYQNYYMSVGYCEREQCNALLQIKGVVSTEEFLDRIPKDGLSCYMIACRFVARRQFLIQNNLFFLDGIYHEDEEWTMRLLCRTEKIKISHYFFYIYRQDREGAITSIIRPKNLEDRFEIIERAKALIEQQNNNPIKIKYIKCRMGQLYLSNMIDISSLNAVDREKIYKKLIYLKYDCINYMCGRIGTPVKLCVKFIGIKNTCYILGGIRRIHTRYKTR